MKISCIYMYTQYEYIYIYIYNIYLAKMALIFNIVDKHEHLDVGVS